MPYLGGLRYLEAGVLKRHKAKMVPILYEHLLTNLRLASTQIDSGDLEGKSASLEKSSTILMELISGLDFDNRTEAASRLSALYAYFVSEIATVEGTLDTARLGRLIEMIAGLFEAWTQTAEALAPRMRRNPGRGMGIPSA